MNWDHTNHKFRIFAHYIPLVMAILFGLMTVCLAVIGHHTWGIWLQAAIWAFYCAMFEFGIFTPTKINENPAPPKVEPLRPSPWIQFNEAWPPASKRIYVVWGGSGSKVEVEVTEHVHLIQDGVDVTMQAHRWSQSVWQLRD